MIAKIYHFFKCYRRSKTKNFLSISFSASRWRGGGRRREKNARKFFGFCTRESASVSEAHWFASPRKRSVRGSFKSPRAPRVRSGFAQRLIHHRRKKLPNPKGGKKPAPKAPEGAKEAGASRRLWTGGGKNRPRRAGKGGGGGGGEWWVFFFLFKKKKKKKKKKRQTPPFSPQPVP